VAGIRRLCETILSPDGLRAHVDGLRAKLREQRHSPAERKRMRERLAALEKEIAEGVRRLRHIAEALLP
jgi:hypothetical protein